MDDEDRELGRTPSTQGRNPDWTIKTVKHGIVTSSVGDPKCRFELEVSKARVGKVMAEVWDDQRGSKQFMGRIVLPEDGITAAAFKSFKDGGVGKTYTLLLENRPSSDDDTSSKGVLTVRVDPVGAPPAPGLSEEELAAAKVALYELNEEFMKAELEAQRLAEEAANLAREKSQKKKAAEEEKSRAPLPMPGSVVTNPMELK
jgi:hypothetical protein